MIVQFPEANAQYEYQHESKRFMKVITPRENEAEAETNELYYNHQQHHDESIDGTSEEITVGINERATAQQSSERAYGKKSPGTKMRQSHL